MMITYEKRNGLQKKEMGYNKKVINDNFMWLNLMVIFSILYNTGLWTK